MKKLLEFCWMAGYDLEIQFKYDKERTEFRFLYRSHDLLPDMFEQKCISVTMLDKDWGDDDFVDKLINEVNTKRMKGEK